MPRRRKTGLMRLAPTLLAVTLAGLAACSTVVSLTYTPTHAVVPGPPSLLAAVSVMDVRGGGEPDVLLTRVGTMGIIPVAYTRRPVADEVAAVFTKALQVRGMVAAAAPYRMRLTLHTLDGETIFRGQIYDGPVTDDNTASVGIDLAVTDQSGRMIYQDVVENSRRVDIPTGSGDDGTLPTLVQALLNADVDLMLDNPAFRVAIQHH